MLPQRPLHRDTILVLPPSPTRLRLQLYTSRRAQDPVKTLRIAVAGNMRLSDVLRQVLHEEGAGGVPERGMVKWVGEWRQVGTSVRVEDIASGEGEVEVKVIVGRGNEEAGEWGRGR